MTPVSSTNKTDPHDITEILLKVALSTIKPTKYILLYNFRRENSTLLEPQDVDKISSSESILTESCRSAPCDLRENSVTDINTCLNNTYIHNKIALFIIFHMK
jgi:hypothetical protein